VTSLGATHTQDWAATIGRFDGFVFVTAEYNHSRSGVLKNAIDFLYAEWPPDRIKPRRSTRCSARSSPGATKHWRRSGRF